jgi:Zn-dependent peptidase ImmA (M78 family)
VVSVFRRNLATASMEATRLHKRMNTPLDRPVDVFLLAQRLGLWLAAQPLDAYGFYLRQGNASGIVVNSRHPESLQRYTCAHEIGHHILGHESHADDASTLNRYSQLGQQELQAQVFAASLLMPLPVVRHVLREIWTERASLGPVEVYLFSRNIGVSYAAAAWQLAEYKLLSRGQAKQLVKQGAAAAKDELRGMTWVAEARADVWVLDEHWDGIAIACRVGDEVHLRLPEDLSTGRMWTIDAPAVGSVRRSVAAGPALSWNGAEDIDIAAIGAETADVGGVGTLGLDLVRDVHIGATGQIASHRTDPALPYEELALFDHDDGPQTTAGGAWPAIPGAGRRAMVLVPQSAGTFRIALSLRPAWNPGGSAARTFSFTVSARNRDRLSGAGYANPQKVLRVERLAAA